MKLEIKQYFSFVIEASVFCVPQLKDLGRLGSSAAGVPWTGLWSSPTGVGILFVQVGTSARDTRAWPARGARLTCTGVMSVAGSPVVTQQMIVILCTVSHR